jgi:hypothetical protein
VGDDGSASSERGDLFDLAVARADAYLRRARPPLSDDPAGLRRALEVWALKTRFASRVDLDEVVRALRLRPPDPTASGAPPPRWRGGPSGSWG